MGRFYKTSVPEFSRDLFDLPYEEMSNILQAREKKIQEDLSGLDVYKDLQTESLPENYEKRNEKIKEINDRVANIKQQIYKNPTNYGAVMPEMEKLSRDVKFDLSEQGELGTYQNDYKKYYAEIDRIDKDPLLKDRPEYKASLKANIKRDYQQGAGYARELKKANNSLVIEPAYMPITQDFADKVLKDLKPQEWKVTRGHDGISTEWKDEKSGKILTKERIHQAVIDEMKRDATFLNSAAFSERLGVPTYSGAMPTEENLYMTVKNKKGEDEKIPNPNTWAGRQLIAAERGFINDTTDLHTSGLSEVGKKQAKDNIDIATAERKERETTKYTPSAVVTNPGNANNYKEWTSSTAGLTQQRDSIVNKVAQLVGRKTPFTREEKERILKGDFSNLKGTINNATTNESLENIKEQVAETNLQKTIVDAQSIALNSWIKKLKNSKNPEDKRILNGIQWKKGLSIPAVMPPGGWDAFKAYSGVHKPSTTTSSTSLNEFGIVTKNELKGFTNAILANLPNASLNIASAFGEDQVFNSPEGNLKLINSQIASELERKGFVKSTTKNGDYITYTAPIPKGDASGKKEKVSEITYVVAKSGDEISINDLQKLGIGQIQASEEDDSEAEVTMNVNGKKVKHTIGMPSVLKRTVNGQQKIQIPVKGDNNHLQLLMNANEIHEAEFQERLQLQKENHRLSEFLTQIPEKGKLPPKEITAVSSYTGWKVGRDDNNNWYVTDGRKTVRNLPLHDVQILYAKSSK